MIGKSGKCVTYYLESSNYFYQCQLSTGMAPLSIVAVQMEPISFLDSFLYIDLLSLLSSFVANKVVWPSCHQSVFMHSSNIHPADVRQLSSSQPEVVRQFAGCYQTAIRKSSGHLQANLSSTVEVSLFSLVDLDPVN